MHVNKSVSSQDTVDGNILATHGRYYRALQKEDIGDVYGSLG